MLVEKCLLAECLSGTLLAGRSISNHSGLLEASKNYLVVDRHRSVGGFYEAEL